MLHTLIIRFKQLSRAYWLNLVNSTSFISTYYLRNELLWVDGFLFDFLQKKTADLWIRKFVIFTGFLFSERLVFENVVRIYLDNMIWPSNNYSVFEASNVSELLTNILFLYFMFINVLFTSYIVLIV